MRPVPFVRRRRPAATPPPGGCHRSTVDEGASPPATARVALLGELARLGPALEFRSRGRLACADAPADAAVVVTAPCGRAVLHELLDNLIPGADLVVVDHNAACTPLQIASFLDAGAATVVLGGSSRVLTSHLQALVRRRRLTRAEPLLPP